MRTNKSKSKSKQHVLDFAIEPSRRRSKNGKKIGRPRKPGAGVPHVRREALDPAHPVHVTLRLEDGLPSLRRKDAARAIEACFVAAKGRHGSRLTDYSIQDDHIHMIQEIEREYAEERREGGRWIRDGRGALSVSMKGLKVRLARSLNRTWGRTGRVLAERYHVHALRTPREVRHAKRYVLDNVRVHGTVFVDRISDPFSSARYADAPLDLSEDPFLANVLGPPENWPVVSPWTWLGARGWLRG